MCASDSKWNAKRGLEIIDKSNHNDINLCLSIAHEFQMFKCNTSCHATQSLNLKHIYIYIIILYAHTLYLTEQALTLIGY